MLATRAMATAEMTNKWVSALTDDSAGITTFASCISLSDMYGDGDTKLVLAHIGSSKFNMRLKVYKGVSVIAESALADVPTAVVSFNNEKITLPSLAIASGAFIRIYKNLKPYYQYSTPSTPIHIVEQEAWSKASQQELTHEELFTVIKGLANEVSLNTKEVKEKREE
uniref:BBS1 domain-containing protein n=1 Tax=Heterorhabditis bacteriophora TaxID=37862 RepID=A0A1I7WKB2_HETBA